MDEEEQERMFSVYDPLALTIRGFMEFYRKLRWIVPGRTRIIGTKTQEVWKTAAAEYRNLYGSRHAFGVCTSKTPGNDVWVTSYMKENRSEAEIRKSENDKEENVMRWYTAIGMKKR